MNSRSISLKQLTAQQLPPKFVRDLIQAVSSIYPESYQAVVGDVNLGEDQENYVLGHYRRGIAETLFSRIAAKHGLKQESVQPDNGGCKHVRIYAGTMSLVLCHVQGTNTFPRHSDNREQSAQINDHLCQMQLLPKEVSKKTEEKLYGIIAHSEFEGKKAELGSIKIGFPNIGFNGWIEEPLCLNDISDMQDSLLQESGGLHAQTENSSPQWKKSYQGNTKNSAKVNRE